MALLYLNWKKRNCPANYNLPEIRISSNDKHSDRNAWPEIEFAYIRVHRIRSSAMQFENLGKLFQPIRKLDMPIIASTKWENKADYRPSISSSFSHHWPTSTSDWIIEPSTFILNRPNSKKSTLCVWNRANTALQFAFRTQFTVRAL